MPKKKEEKRKKPAVKPEVKKAIKKEVEKQVEKEVDEAQDEIAEDISKDITKAIKKQFDIVDRFHKLEYHHKFLFAVIVGFGVVSFWRGLWVLMDHFIFPGYPALSGIFTTLLGLTILAASGALMRVFHS